MDLSRARPVAVAPGVRPIRGLVFDKDGTLFDFHATWSGWAAGFIEAMTRGRPERTDTLAAALGFDLGARRFARDSPVIAGTMEVVVEAVRRVVPEMGEPVLRQLIIDGTVAAPQAEAAPLGPLFDVLLEAGLVLGLATNDSEVPARAHLERAGILGRFVFVAGYDSGHGAKPGPGQLEAFCRATGLPAETCAMVGDSRHDLASGRAAGMVTVGVLTGLAGPEDLADLADVILPDIGMLPAWLGL